MDTCTEGTNTNDEGMDMETADSQESAGSNSKEALLKTFDVWVVDCIEGGGQQVNHAAVVSEENIRSNARSLFESLVTESAASSEKIMPVGSDEARALLISRLGPAISHQSLLVKRNALYCLLGSIEGNNNDISQHVRQLLGKFMLEHCSPMDIVNDDGDADVDDDDDDDQVRDAAVKALSMLVQSGDSTASSTNAQIELSMKARIDMATKGVEKRCATESSDNFGYDHGYDHRTTDGDIISGLSLLPRAKRSLCFTLLESCIVGIEKDAARIEKYPSSDVQKDLATFCSFAATCLHGESDPRCLMQMLGLLHKVQRAINPLFDESAKKQVACFPATEIFDAVAPYYPVQFTPPPNDVHGITREGLNQALMAVLCFRDKPKTCLHENDDSMMALSTKLFLDRLMPTKEDSPFGMDGPNSDPMTSTVHDKIEALADLTRLLLDEETDDSSQLPIYGLNLGLVSLLSSALIATHAESCGQCLIKTAELAANKQLADKCRVFASSVAYYLELDPSKDVTNSLWNVFVKNAVSNQTQILSSSPQSTDGRTSIAFIASLASCGGQQTLQCCLNSSLPYLIDCLSKEEETDKMVASCYGIGALLSSCRLSVDRGKKREVEIHPHPLENFASSTTRALCAIILKSDRPSSECSELKKAAACGLESVVLAIPPALLSNEEVTLLMDTFSSALASLTSTRNAPENGEELEQDARSFHYAYSRLLGSVVGRSMAHAEDLLDAQRGLCVLENESMKLFSRDLILTSLLSSALSESVGTTSPTNEMERYDRKALATACNMSKGASLEIVSALSDSLYETSYRCIQGDADAELPPLTPAFVLSYLFRESSNVASSTFHSLEPPHKSLNDLLELIGRENISSAEGCNDSKRVELSDRGQLEVGLSQLKLPIDDSEMKAKTKRRLLLSHRLVPHLVSAYTGRVEPEVMREVVDFVNLFLPPLSSWDDVKLCASLPLLSAILSNDQVSFQSDDSIKSKLIALVPDLVEYSLRLENDPQGRAGASSCVFSILSKHQQEAGSCICSTIITNTVFPAVNQISSALAKEQKDDAQMMTMFRETLNIAALVGSAAAFRGMASSGTANQVANFLVDLATKGSTALPGTGEAVKFSERQRREVSMIAASCFGGMLSVRGGSPFWKQRVVHMFLPVTVDAYRAGHSEIKPLISSEQDGEISNCLASLIVASHMICCVPLPALASDILADVSGVLLHGLGSLSRSCDFSRFIPSTTLLLTALMKVVSMSPKSIASSVSTLVQILSQVVSRRRGSHPDDAISYLIFALQLLGMIAKRGEWRKRLSPLRHAVVSSTRKSLDHPAVLLRQAAVHVNNVWSMLD